VNQTAKPNCGKKHVQQPISKARRSIQFLLIQTILNTGKTASDTTNSAISAAITARFFPLLRHVEIEKLKERKKSEMS